MSAPGSLRALAAAHRRAEDDWLEAEALADEVRSRARAALRQGRERAADEMVRLADAERRLGLLRERARQRRALLAWEMAARRQGEGGR